MMQEFLFLSLLIFIIWFWRDSMKTHEKAVDSAKRACHHINAQLLDDTVVLNKLRLCRTNNGTMALCRLYSFDFTMDGQLRRLGNISMKGYSIVDIVLDIDRATTLQ